MAPSIAIVLTDAQRKIIWVNDGFTKMTGYSLPEVVGKKPSILQGPASEPSVIERIRKCLDREIPLKENITNYRKNGESYTCKLVVHPIFSSNGDLTNFIAFEVDGDEVENEEEIPLMRLNNGTKYASSSLKGVEEIQLYERLCLLVESEMLYLDPNLSLRNVADRLNTNTKYLSQVVNHQSENNFQHFVNTYRVRAVKDKIQDKAHLHLTLYGIARQCGFKNKSTFYKVFKEITGRTPREYLKLQEQEA
jgi:PAS domain S-box-containing protein